MLSFFKEQVTDFLHYQPVKLFFASWIKIYFSYYSVTLPLDTEFKILTRLANPGFDIYQIFI